MSIRPTDPSKIFRGFACPGLQIIFRPFINPEPYTTQAPYPNSQNGTWSVCVYVLSNLIVHILLSVHASKSIHSLCINIHAIATCFLSLPCMAKTLQTSLAAISKYAHLQSNPLDVPEVLNPARHVTQLPLLLLHL